jgi:predicted ABC-type ATPase
MVILAGPNGAGKSTAAGVLLPAGMTFVNADEIAKGLSGYPSRSADLEAARLALLEVDELERGRRPFAIETTLASRSLAPRAERLRSVGYLTRLIFLYLPSAELAVARVSGRVRLGGHHIPEAVIRRRYEVGIRNFFSLYRGRVDRWSVFDSSLPSRPRFVAGGQAGRPDVIRRPEIWDRMRKGAGS